MANHEETHQQTWTHERQKVTRRRVLSRGVAVAATAATFTLGAKTAFAFRNRAQDTIAMAHQSASSTTTYQIPEAVELLNRAGVGYR